MTSTVTLDGIEEPIVLSPSGMAALLDLRALDVRAPGATLGRFDIHPAARQRLAGQGLVEVNVWGVAWLTDLGRRVADAIAEESL